MLEELNLPIIFFISFRPHAVNENNKKKSRLLEN